MAGNKKTGTQASKGKGRASSSKGKAPLRPSGEPSSSSRQPAHLPVSRGNAGHDPIEAEDGIDAPERSGTGPASSTSPFRTSASQHGTTEPPAERATNPGSSRSKRAPTEHSSRSNTSAKGPEASSSRKNRRSQGAQQPTSRTQTTKPTGSIPSEPREYASNLPIRSSTAAGGQTENGQQPSSQDASGQRPSRARASGQAESSGQGAGPLRPSGQTESGQTGSRRRRSKRSSRNSQPFFRGIRTAISHGSQKVQSLLNRHSQRRASQQSARELDPSQRTMSDYTSADVYSNPRTLALRSDPAAEAQENMRRERLTSGLSRAERQSVQGNRLTTREYEEADQLRRRSEADQSRSRREAADQQELEGPPAFDPSDFMSPAPSTFSGILGRPPPPKPSILKSFGQSLSKRASENSARASGGQSKSRVTFQDQVPGPSGERASSRANPSQPVSGRSREMVPSQNQSRQPVPSGSRERVPSQPRSQRHSSRNPTNPPEGTSREGTGSRPNLRGGHVSPFQKFAIARAGSQQSKPPTNQSNIDQNAADDEGYANSPSNDNEAQPTYSSAGLGTDDATPYQDDDQQADDGTDDSQYDESPEESSEDSYLES
jgi:hypothetical protein